MLSRILSLPFFVILMGIASISMIFPAAHAATVSDHHTMRSFFYSGILLLTLTTLIAIATAANAPKNPNRSYLLTILAAFVALPLMLAMPVNIAVGNTTFLNSYVEMVSSLTTTGASLFDDPTRLPQSVHLWRAMVGWMGGFLVLVTAVAIFAPMNLGGFEVLSSLSTRRRSAVTTDTVWAIDGSARLKRFGARLFPVYAGLTLALWVLLLLFGDTPLVALCHAMSVFATSGISPVGGLEGARSGVSGEIAIFVFLMFALSRQTFVSEQSGRSFQRILADPEVKIAAFCLVSVPSLLFLRHWFGALEVNEFDNFRAGISALWGSIFTVLSFLTTTGFESAAWSDSQSWSGLRTPGIILMGLALVGGGVATTAGGVKLLRVYALYKHGVREMDRLVYPSSVGGSGSAARRLRRQGAYVAWIFFMLFALSVAATVLAFTLAGLDVESAMTLAIAALSNTGPLVSVAGENVTSYGNLNDAGKLILAAAMVLGRLEMLAIIALFNPDFWRT